VVGYLRETAPVRILHVLPSLSPGGMERLVIQLAADATGHGDSVVVAAGRGEWEQEVRGAGAMHVVLPATARGSAFSVATATATARLARCIRHVRPHVVHAHNVRAAALARLALVGTRDRSVLMPTLHGLAPGDYGTASRVLRGLAHRVIACAPSVARSLEAAGFPGDRIDVIVNGAALDPASLERQAHLRASLQLGSAPLVVGIGRLVEQKNWPVFIEAAGRLSGPSFAVAGDGPLRQELTGLARRSGNRVRFLGVVDDIAALVGLACCVVSTSNWEGLPLTLLEALSLGIPVVATAVDGVTDLVPAAAALLVAPGDPVAVSRAISRVLSDDDLAADLRRNALAAAPSWEPQGMLDRYRNAYQVAWAGKSPWA
jgi:glycosyltransferase involved in cell wall biosynthesis